MAAQPTITLLYPVAPAGSDSKPFNFDYYINSHMADVQAQWPAYGLLDWDVVKIDEASGYVAMVVMRWRDAEGFAKAAGASPGILADGPNYSSTKPLLLVGSVVAISPK